MSEGEIAESDDGAHLPLPGKRESAVQEGVAAINASDEDIAEAIIKQARMFPTTESVTKFDPTKFKAQYSLNDKLPHGAHPNGVLIGKHRQKYNLYLVDEPQQSAAADANGLQQQTEPTIKEYYPSWGVWAELPDRRFCRWVDPNVFSDMPEQYVRCLSEVINPHELLCGLREPESPVEGRLVREAVESMYTAFIHRMLVIQMKYTEITNGYNLLSKDSIQRHAACSLLNKGPTHELSTKDSKDFHKMYAKMVAPFEKDIREYDRPSLLQFFEKQLGTLYIFGIPVLSTRVMRTEPGWRETNKFLETVGSKLRMRLCVLGSSTELLLGEPVLEKCTANTIVMGTERARTAMMAFEVASTQDTSETPVKMFREESTAFIVHHKWSRDRIRARDWNRRTYGPTQKAAVLLAEIILQDENLYAGIPKNARKILDGSKDRMGELLKYHCIESIIEYQEGEGYINRFTFSPHIRGILHATFSRNVSFEDMHSYLTDTVSRPAGGGVLYTILQMRFKHPELALMRALMYVTDAWFGDDRLYTVMMIGGSVASVVDNKLDLNKLEMVVLELHRMTVKTLEHLAMRVEKRFRDAKYRVLSHSLDFDAISNILTRQYHRNDGHVNESSLRFNSSFWINILGYYIRLTNSEEVLELESNLIIQGFIDDVLKFLKEMRQDLDLEIRDENVKVRLKACFNVFSAEWDKCIKGLHASLLEKMKHAKEEEPSAKRQRIA